MTKREIIKKSIVDSIIGIPEESFVYSSNHTTRDGFSIPLSVTYHRNDFDTLVAEDDIADIAKRMTINDTYYCIPMINLLEEAIVRSNESLSQFGFQLQYYTHEDKKEMVKDLSQRYVQRLRRYSKGYRVVVHEFSDFIYGFRFESYYSFI